MTAKCQAGVVWQQMLLLQCRFRQGLAGSLLRGLHLPIIQVEPETRTVQRQPVQSLSVTAYSSEKGNALHTHMMYMFSPVTYGTKADNPSHYTEGNQKVRFLPSAIAMRLSASALVSSVIHPLHVSYTLDENCPEALRPDRDVSVDWDKPRLFVSDCIVAGCSSERSMRAFDGNS